MSSITNTSTSATDGASVPNDFFFVAGPMLIGAIISWALYGALVVQIYLYYLAFPRDKTWVKVTVYGLFLIDTFQNATCLQSAWYYCIMATGRGAEYTSWGLQMSPINTAVVSVWVQMVYAWRIQALGQRHPFWVTLVVLMILVSFAQAGAGCYITAKFFTSDTILFVWNNLYVSVGVQLVGSLAVDAVIAISMMFLLGRAKKITQVVPGNEDTTTTLSRLIQLTIESGAITAIVAGAKVVLIYTMPTTLLFMASASIQSKIYTNALMATFNSRSSILTRRHWDIQRLATTATHGAVSTTVAFKRPDESDETKTTGRFGSFDASQSVYHPPVGLASRSQASLGEA